MKGATLRVLQVQWERAWLAEDFPALDRIDQARRVIEGLPTRETEEAAPTSDSVFFIKVTSPLPEPAPRTRSRFVSGMFARLGLFTK